MEQTVNLVKVHDAFNRFDQDRWIAPYNGETLLALRDSVYKNDEEIVVSINGKAVPFEYLDYTYPKSGDCVVFVPKIAGPGGNPLATIAMIGIMAVAWWAAPIVGFAALQGAVGLAGGTLAGGIGLAIEYGVMASVMIGSALLGGAIVNALFPAANVNPVSVTGTDFANSNYYSWSPQTTQAQGGVIPKFYGKVKLTGNIISAYSEPIDNDNYLNVLIHLGLGPYKSISTLKINDQPIANFENVTNHIRYGRLTQEVISNFNDTKTEYTTNILIEEGNPYTYRTIGNAFDRLETEITFNGLYYSNDSGGLSSVSVDFSIRAVGVTLGNYYDLAPSPTTVTDATNSAVKKIYAENVIRDRYDITITRITGNRTSHRYGDKMYLTAVKETLSDDFSYPGAALVGLKALASSQLSGSLRFSCIAETSLIRVYRADEVLGTDGKNYRCKANHTASATNRPITGVDWATCWEQKGRSASLNSTAWVTGTAYTTTKSWRVEYNNSYAWVCYDALTQPVIKDDNTIERYDGYAPAKLITADFEAFADFCDTLVNDGIGGLEHRFSFNGGFDSEGNLWSVANKIAGEARGLLVWRGYSISVVIDQAATAVQMFSSGNINMDTFKETFLPMEDRAGEIEVSFNNIDRDYEKDTYFYFNSTLDKPSNKVSTQLIGCTSGSQAWRYAKYCLDGNQYWKRTIEFDVDVDALACTIGDVISFQHDVPQWGLYGGRVVSATSTTVTLDQAVVLAAATTYAIMIRLLDDTLVTKTIASPAGTYTTISVSTPFTSVPVCYDPFALGVSGVETKAFRVCEVSRTGDTMFTLGAIEYDANVYAVDSGTPVIPTVNYSAITKIEPVTGLLLYSNSYVDQSGNSRGVIGGSFTKPSSNVVYAKARIWCRKYDATLGGAQLAYQVVGETYTETFNIDNLEFGQTYQVLVQSVSFDGETTDMSVSPSSVITLRTYVDNTQVSSIRIMGLQLFEQFNDNVFTGRDAKFTWNAVSVIPLTSVGAGEEAYGAGTGVPPTWFKSYKISIFSSDNTLRRTDYSNENIYTYTLDKNIDDGVTETFYIGVQALDIFGVLSEMTKLLVENLVPSDIANLTTAPTVGGIKFSWSKNTDADFKTYTYRTQVESDGWSAWIDGEDNSVTRNLTAAEILAHTNKAIIYIEVKAKDWYDQVSTTAAAANAVANTIADNLFQLVASTDGTGTVSDLYNGNTSSGGVTIA